MNDGCQGKLGTKIYDKEKCFLGHSVNLREFRDFTAMRHAGYESVGE
jgi:cbb3-type cytochrome oxidase cytochrome c subunit